MISGLVIAAISGTRSTREEYVRRASSPGLRLSAFLVAAGRHTRIGTRDDEALAHALVLANPCVRTFAHQSPVDTVLRVFGTPTHGRRRCKLVRCSKSDVLSFVITFV
jgi:hypothetical protein